MTEIALDCDYMSETGIGGSKRTERWGGGELTPKVAPRKLGLLTPKLTIFYRISVERGQFCQGRVNPTLEHTSIACGC